jgi:hypothetical protein
MTVKTLKESDIEDYLVKRVHAMGGEMRKVKWTGRKSAPDRVVMRCCKNPTVWVELKRPGGKVAFPKNAHEEAQAREHDRMRRAGQYVVVIDSFEGVDALLA